jgi:peptidoglycan/LPS O-acetylase OafA/YrhL
MYALFGLANLGAYKNSGNYFNPDSNPLLHTWSLSVESQYYFVIPFLLLVWHLLKINLNVRIKYLYPLFAVFIISFAFFVNQNIEISLINIFFPNVNESFLYYSPFSRFWQLILGGFAAVYEEKIKKSTIFKKSIFLRIELIKFYAFTTIPIILITDNYELKTIITSVTTSMLLVKGYNLAGKLKMLIWIGDRSYSIYLIHYPLNYFIKKKNDIL